MIEPLNGISITIIAAAATVAFVAVLAACLLARRLATTRRALHLEAEQSSQAQRQHLESRRRLQLLLDHMPDGVLAFGADGLIEWINPAARSIFHCSVADAVGHAAAALIPAIDTLLPDQPAAAPQGMAPAQVPRLSTRGRRRDGTEFPLEIALVWLRTDGPRAGMCVCRDITDAQRVDRIKSDFVSMVSHELRTPLTSLRGSLALLTDGTVDGLPVDALRLLRLASNNAERLVVLVNDILDYEKLRAGAMKVDIEPVDLEETARCAVESLEGMALPARVQFALVGDREGIQVLADPARLVQVLTNLLSNAIKFSPPLGTVRVRLANAGERARLTVTDDGPGVPAEFVPRLFRPFEQANDPHRGKRGGSGLGLAISYGLIEMMHGAIGVSPPIPGRGAEFWIELPLNTARPSTFGDLV